MTLEIKKNEQYLENSEKIIIKKGCQYSVSSEFVGFTGEKYTGYFSVIFFDESENEIIRRIFWLNNFSGNSSKININFTAMSDLMTLGYRINTEGSITSNCKFSLKSINEIKLNEEDPNTEEFFHSLQDCKLPRLEELSATDEVKLEENLVWVFSTHRSGSTWLVSQLLSYDTFCLNEPHISAHLSLREEGITDNLVRRIDHMKNFPSYFFSKRYSLTWKYYMRKLILNRINAEVDNLEKKIIIKEPGGIVGAPDIILQLSSKSKMIALLRDGRDVIDSIFDARQKSGFMVKYGDTPIELENREDTIEYLANSWKYYMKNLVETYNQHPAKLRYMVKYEDLLEHTFDKLESLYKFIDISITQDQLHQIIKKYSFENIPQDKKGSGQFARSAKPGSWKAHFSEKEIQKMNKILGDTLKKLGYDL